MWRVLLMLLPTAALADSVVATRPIRAMAVITPEDVTTVAADIDGALQDVAAAVGQEARVMIYPGRPVRSGDLGLPSIVERNAVVPLSYRTASLVILTEGRALDRGGAGDAIRVMNLTSRTIVTGLIGPDGTVNVGPNS